MMKNKQNMKKVVPLIALAVLLLVSLACGANATPALVSTSAPPASSDNTDPEPTATTQAAAPTSPQNYNVGNVISIGDHNLVVVGWKDVPGNDFSKPDAGKKFIAVDLIIVNKSQTATTISTLLQMSLKDDTGQKYDVDFMASPLIGSGSLDGELAPGEKVRSKVGYQIPENAQGLQFVFDADVWSSGKVFVDLGTEPVTVEPPASIEGETSQQTYNVGDVIQIGTVTLTVNGVSNPAGDQFNKPNAGNKFLIVDLTIENKGASAISISTLLQMSLKDPSGQKYNDDFSASMASGGGSPDGEIVPGEKLRGQVGFQVPENVTGLVFVFDADLSGSGKVFITLP